MLRSNWFRIHRVRNNGSREFGVRRFSEDQEYDKILKGSNAALKSFLTDEDSIGSQYDPSPNDDRSLGGRYGKKSQDFGKEDLGFRGWSTQNLDTTKFQEF